MTTIPHLNTDCQEDIPFETGPITRLPTPEAEGTLAGLLAASYRAGEIDAAGADAAMMPYEIWFETREHEEYEYEEVTI